MLISASRASLMSLKQYKSATRLSKEIITIQYLTSHIKRKIKFRAISNQDKHGTDLTLQASRHNNPGLLHKLLQIQIS